MAGTVQAQFRLHLVDDATAVIDTYPPPEQPFDDGDVRPKLLRCGRNRTTVTSGLAFDRAILQEILPIPEEAFRQGADGYLATVAPVYGAVRSEEHTSELQSLMRISYAVFCLKKKKDTVHDKTQHTDKKTI